MTSSFEALRQSSSREWLEPDGSGGFASGTVAGTRTRRYHALLLTALTPPTGRVVLVNGFDAWIETPAGRFALSSQHYTPGVVSPDGAQRIEEFRIKPWPRWTFRFEDGTGLTQDIFVSPETRATVLGWRLSAACEQVKLFVRPFLSGRDYHCLHKENAAFHFEPELNGEKVTWHPYAGLPGIMAMHNGRYSHAPVWYRNFFYAEEHARGLDDTEDLASPGTFQWDLSAGEAIWLLTTTASPALALKRDASVARFARSLRELETLRRNEFPSPLHHAADAYIVNCVRRNEVTETPADGRASGRQTPGKTILAGYPWFTDWGRDTFIALRGLCLATGRLADAREILLAWAGAVSEGMLPNRFPDQGERPEFNSVDASLWYIIAVGEYLEAAGGARKSPPASDRKALHGAMQAILEGYARGTRFGIRMAGDGLLACGVPGAQLTWMDAKIGDWVVTPRIGKPVEIQALWLNALEIGAACSSQWRDCFERGLNSFQARFWNAEAGCLYDVVDCNHQSGTVDATIRPNQILAVGGLPLNLLPPAEAIRVVAAIEAKLLTPLGLRSLAPGEPGYAGRYSGGPRERDSVYHQGTVWPWLIGPFAEAWVRVRGGTEEAKIEARKKFLEPLLAHLDAAGLAHISEIADAEAPHTPRGCPWQAWSVGEVLRLELTVLKIPSQTPAHGRAVPSTRRTRRSDSPRRPLPRGVIGL